MYNLQIEDSTSFRIEIQSEIKRKIELIKLISKEQKWYTFQEISKVIKFSSKTISKDLSYLKDILPNGWNLNVKKGYGVQLILPLDATIEEIISLFFRDSLTFNILDRLLKHGETTVNNLAKDLHVQPYIISKALKKIEKDLACYELKLKRRPIRIAGSEWKIMLMFTSLYTKAYVDSDWPFNLNQDSIINHIKNIENSLDMVLYLSSRRKFSYFLAIMFIRKEQEHDVQWDEDFFKLNVNTPYFEKISMYLDELQSKEGMIFSVPEKIILTMVYKCLNFVYKFPEKENEIKIFHTKKIQIYTIIKDFIEMLYERLEDNFLKEDEFVYSMILHFRKNIYRLHFYGYVKRADKHTTNFIKKNYSETFLQVTEAYNNWIQKHQIAIKVTNEELVNIVVYIESQRIKQKTTSKKAIIVTKEGDCWKEYISAKLKEKLGDKIEFPKIISLNIAKGLELEEIYDIDFIISTIPLKQLAHPVILVQPTISDRDVYNIKKHIQT